MSTQFLLDTNAYFMLFQLIKNPAYNNLLEKLNQDGIYSFYISEITSMEIHSVLGKYRRGIQPQKQLCNKKVRINGVESICSHEWYTEGSNKLKPRVFKHLKKLINDMENCKGVIKANVIPLNQTAISKAKLFLMQYADLYKFGSHDALIAGSVISANENYNLNLTLITSDKGLKAALKDANVSYYDPCG